MKKTSGTKVELIAEISSAKRRIKKLEQSEAKRRQAESQWEAALEELRKSEKKYKGLTENINLGIYRNTVGHEGKFIEANPSIIAMFGYKRKRNSWAYAFPTCIRIRKTGKNSMKKCSGKGWSKARNCG